VIVCTVLYVWFVYSVVVWQHVISIDCILCGGREASDTYGLCTVLF